MRLCSGVICNERKNRKRPASKGCKNSRGCMADRAISVLDVRQHVRFEKTNQLSVGAVALRTHEA
eukprot:2083235-Pyramimonas_sp.AAC.1